MNHAEDIKNMLIEAFDKAKINYNDNIIDFIINKAISNNNDIINVLYNGGYDTVAKEYEKLDKVNLINVLNYTDLVNNYIDINDWRVKENSTVTYSIGGLILSNSGAVTANYWLNNIYDKEIRDAHKNADIHIHDLSMLAPYCAGWNLKTLIKEGLGGVPSKITSAPAKHLHTLCNQMVNFLGILQNEWAGAQAFSSFDTYLAPFIKVDNLSYEQTKQCIQSFIFGVNTPSRWGCVPIDTEVLSLDGWKDCDSLTESDYIYTWNMSSRKLELNKVNKVICKPFKGKLHLYKDNRGYEQLVTPNHRMLTYKYNSDESIIKKSEEIFDSNTNYGLPAKLYGSEIEDTDLSDEEIALAAMLYTDGSFEFRDNNNIHKIILKKSINRCGNSEIQRCCEKLNVTYSLKSGKSFGKLDDSHCVNTYSFYGDSARKLVSLCGNKYSIDSKFFNLSERQANLFLKTWALFDGDEHKMNLQCDSYDIAKQIQHIAILAGYTSYIKTHKYKSGKLGIYVKLRHKQKCINSYTKSEVEYDGLVWCPNVNNGTAIFRRNGNTFISGQTQAPFSNITLDWTVPADLKDMPAIVGGKEMDFTYGDCKEEMDMVNKAFIEIMIEGDANGRGFQYPIPTYSITKDFDWSNTENNRLLFEMTAKYGTPYFSNYVNSDMSPNDVRSMCCRLRLDLRELRKKSGGYFGSGENTGSVGVVTINLPRISYLSNNEKDFYNRLDKMMDICAKSLKIKRNTVTELLKRGLYPYTKRYLGNFDNHFSTIATIGMNEMCLNAKWLKRDLTDIDAQKFTINVLNHMRERLSDYQEQYGDLYNLEAAPAESTTYRLAKHDKEKFPNIITAAGDCGTPYYTNSSHLPVGFTEDIFSALDIQDELQTLYTSGTVFHAFLGEKLPDWKAAANIVRKIAENYKLPYYTLSPTYSICHNHGYINGEAYKCPECNENTEVYSRITGYYRPVQNWNDGKLQEFKDRKNYNINNNINTDDIDNNNEQINNNDNNNFENCASCNIENILYHDYSIKLFATKTCPKCKIATQLLENNGINFEKLYVEDNMELAKSLELKQAPTLWNESTNEFVVDLQEIKKYIELLID